MQKCAATLFLGAIVGCADSSKAPPNLPIPEKPRPQADGRAPSDSVSDSSKSAPASSIVPPPPAAVTQSNGHALQDVDLAGYQAKLADQKGKIVVVDAWATWCVPCRAKFPKFVALADAKAGKNFAFMSLAVDETDAGKAQDFLKVARANFPNLRLAKVPSKEWQAALGFDTVPHYLVYDAAGKSILRTDKFEDLEAKLAELTKK